MRKNQKPPHPIYIGLLRAIRIPFHPESLRRLIDKLPIPYRQLPRILPTGIDLRRDSLGRTPTDIRRALSVVIDTQLNIPQQIRRPVHRPFLGLNFLEKHS